MCVNILKRLTLRSTRVNTVLSIDQEMIPARNAIGTHAQGFVMNDVLSLTILKAFAQYSPILHAD